jgi:Xaa-Pro aminopeptidase
MIDRLSAIRACFDEWQVDALLLISPANRRWVSGFTGSAAQLLISRQRAVLATDSRYWERAAAEAPTFEVFQMRDEKDAMANFLATAGVQRIGVEAAHVTLARQAALDKHEGFTWVPLPATVEALRAVKSAGELAAIRAAARLTDAAVAQVPRLARPGVTERAVAWELEKFMRESGAEDVAFDIIVASGPHSALPHHHPGERVLQAGDIIIVDLGAQVDGYKSDLTRTFYLGESPEDAFWSIYNTVAQAHGAAIGGIRPGVTGKDVDALARDLITAAGHGDHFGHGTGHGVGLEIHEEPRFSKLAEKTIIPAGAVMTVEPGIYLPGYGGVRIEDLLHVTADGSEYLSAAPKTPLIAV